MARILVIDDEPQVRKMLTEILTDEGYEVVEAANGAEGVKLYRQEPTDLVITDIIMPDKEGLETIQDLKGLSPGAKIIAISGGGRVVKEDCLRVAKYLGANYVFCKPLEQEKLLGAIRDLMN